MFNVGNYVVYKRNVCIIKELKEVSGKKYYVLKPINDAGATLFAPVNNEKVESKMRRILTREEILELIETMPDEEANWIHNENERKEKYKRIISSGDRVELIKMIKEHEDLVFDTAIIQSAGGADMVKKMMMMYLCG